MDTDRIVPLVRCSVIEVYTLESWGNFIIIRLSFTLYEQIAKQCDIQIWYCVQFGESRGGGGGLWTWICRDWLR